METLILIVKCLALTVGALMLVGLIIVLLVCIKGVIDGFKDL